MGLTVQIYGFQHVHFGLRLDIVEVELYRANITHNLSDMANEVGIYEAMWQPSDNGFTYAKDLIQVLTKGLRKLKADPDYYPMYENPNGWGLYVNFVPFVENYLDACRLYPDQFIRVYR